jgi:hypothetical protein
MVVSLALATACTPGATSNGETDDDPTAGEQPSVTVTVPPTRLTPFCRAMIDLNDRLENDPPDDVEAEIVETYEGIVDEVPDELRSDFDAVLAVLRGEAPVATTGSEGTTATDAAPTSDPLADEGRSPGDTPAERLSAYVDFACRSVENNPGPPPTQPLGEPSTTEP